MTEQYENLTEGPIFRQVMKVALPVILTSLVQLAYNLTDQMWLGRFGGTDAQAAASTAGYYAWLSVCLGLLGKVGTEVSVGQHFGRRDRLGAAAFLKHGLVVSGVTGLLFMIVSQLSAPQLIALVNSGNSPTGAEAVSYLRIVSAGFVFFLMTQNMTGSFTAVGSTKIPFIISAVGLGLNMVLDPLLINGFWGLPQWGVKGAAVATLISQLTVFLLFMVALHWKRTCPLSIGWPKGWDMAYFRQIFKIGLPVALQSSLFCLIALSLGRIVFGWGESAFAAHNVGAQIESLTWMTTHGVSSALSAFVAQNCGVANWQRIRHGYALIFAFTVFVAVINSLAFIFGGEFIFAIFNREAPTLAYGTQYLFILGMSQVFMTMEIITAGALNGIGRNRVSSLCSFIFSFLRIPASWWLGSYLGYGVTMVWWTMTVTSFFKGVILFFIFRHHVKVGEKEQLTLDQKKN